MAKRNASALDCRRSAGCLATLLLFGGIGSAQTGPAAGISPKVAAGVAGISYVDGQLTINLHNTTLAEVLANVARLTGVTIELPAGAGVEKMQIVELGPGPARQILAALLVESNFDYLIQGADNDSEKIQSVLLMPRGKKEPTPGGMPSVGPRAFRAAVAPPEEPPAPDPAPAVPDIVPPGLTPVNPNSPPPQPQAPQPPPGAQPPYAPLDPSALPPQSVLDQPLPNGLNSDPSTTRPGALTPPPVMNQQNITQQLQQMYQTRVQMNQAAQAGRQ